MQFVRVPRISRRILPSIASVNANIRRGRIIIKTWQYLNEIESILTQNTIEKIIKEA